MFFFQIYNKKIAWPKIILEKRALKMAEKGLKRQFSRLVGNVRVPSSNLLEFNQIWAN